MSSTAQLQARRKRRLARGKGKPPAQPLPKRAQLRYTALLLDMQRTIWKLFKADLFPQFGVLQARAAAELGGLRTDAWIDDVLRIYSGFSLGMDLIHPEAALARELGRVAEDVDEQQAKGFQRQLDWAGAVVPTIGLEPFRRVAARGFVESNLSLIKELMGQQLRRAETIVTQGIFDGLRVEEIMKQLREQAGTTKSKAALLARDQVNKFHGNLNHMRQTSVGINEYTWDDSDDERVRKRHRALDESRQSWARAPIVDLKTGRRNHPGGDYQCRCQALPVFPPELLGTPEPGEP